MIADMRTTLAASDDDGFRRAAHSLKSNAEVFGANALAVPARELELASVAQSTPEIIVLLDRVDAESTRARAELARLQHD